MNERVAGLASGMPNSCACSGVASLSWRALLGVVIALTASAMLARWGEALVRWMLPMMKWIARSHLPEFDISTFEIREVLGQPQLYMQASLAHLLRIGRHDVHGPVWTTGHLTLGAFWQPVAAAIACGAVWPDAREESRTAIGSRKGWSSATGLVLSLTGVLAGLLAGLVATAISIFVAPSMLAGMMIGDIYWHEASDQIMPHIVRLPRFLEEGGWTMLGLTIGAFVGVGKGLLRG